jgi:uncharacterized protein (DUF2342 family)
LHDLTNPVLTDLPASHRQGTSQPIPPCEIVMDKKTKKKIEVARKKIDNLMKQLAGAKQQTDEPDEIEKIQAEIAAKKAEIEKLKNS